MIQSRLALIALIAVFLAGGAADAATKKKTTASSSAPTGEQRKKMWEEGSAECRKKHGANLVRVEVKKYYGKWTVVCYIW